MLLYVKLILPDTNYQKEENMSFHEKNIAVTLSIFTLILAIYLIRIFQMLQTDSFTSTNLFRLWGIVALLAVIGTIIATIFTHFWRYRSQDKNERRSAV